MNVVVSRAAEIALTTLGEEDRRKIHAWFDHLRNWENDEFVRSKSRKLELPGQDQVYILTTSSDMRLFFVLRPEEIEITDIARNDSLRVARQAS